MNKTSENPLDKRRDKSKWKVCHKSLEINKILNKE